MKAMVGGRELRGGRAEPGPRQDGLRTRLGWHRARRGLVVQAVRAGRGDPPGHLAQLEVQRARDRSRSQACPARRPGEDWKVSNYGGTEQGVLDLVDATRVSSNTAYAQLMLEVGPQTSPTWPTASASAPSCPVVPSLVLGSGEVSPLDMAVGYSTFANRGVHNDPVDDRQDRAGRRGRRRAGDRPGRAQRRAGAHRGARPTSSPTACRRSWRAAPARRADFGKPAAGKTGTTQDNKDAWFVGYTPKLTAAVWMGYAGPAARRQRAHHERTVVRRPEPRPAAA